MLNGLLTRNVELEARLKKLEETAEQGTFYIGKFEEEFKRDPKKAMELYVALTLWMNKKAESGLSDEELEEQKKLNDSDEAKPRTDSGKMFRASTRSNAVSSAS